MRILVSAYACEPGRGSEPGVGWNYVKEMSRRHSLSVLTRTNNRTAIEGSGEDWTKSVQWLYYDPPHWLSFWKRGGRGVQLFYLIWQIGAAQFVRRRFSSGDFDAVHHVTFGKYWIPTFVDLPGLPVVFGPVGGGEETPPAFRGTFSFRGRVAETAKKAASWLLPRFPGVRAAYRRMSLCLAATDQTAEKLKRLVPCPIVVFPQSAVSSEDAAAMRGIADAAARSQSPLFVTACRLDHWKAVRLAVEAFASFLRDHPSARLIVLGNGPEKKPLRDLVSRMGLSESVSFPGRLPALRDVYECIASATALLHPALHEAFGQACLEAVALGTPVVCWDWGGPGMICRANGIEPVPVADTAAMSVSGFRDRMERFFEDRRRVSLSSRCTWPAWCAALSEVFPSRSFPHRPIMVPDMDKSRIAHALLDRLEVCGISCTVVHGLEGGEVGRDLDVWIDRKEWDRVSAVAMDFGRSRFLNPVRILGPFGLRFLFFGDSGTCGTLELHCVRNLNWFWVKRPDDIAALHTWKRFAVLLATKQTGKVHRELSREPLATNERALINVFFARRGILCGSSRSRFWDAVDQGDFRTASRLLRRSVFHATPLHPFRFAVFALRRVGYAIWSFRKPAGVCLVIKDGADDPIAIAADLERRRGVLVKVRSVDLRRAGTLKTIVTFIRIRIGQRSQCATIIIIRPGQRLFARILAGPVFHQKGTDPVSRLSESLCALATIRTSQT